MKKTMAAMQNTVAKNVADRRRSQGYVVFGIMTTGKNSTSSINKNKRQQHQQSLSLMNVYRNILPTTFSFPPKLTTGSSSKHRHNSAISTSSYCVDWIKVKIPPEAQSMVVKGGNVTTASVDADEDRTGTNDYNSRINVKDRNKISRGDDTLQFITRLIEHAQREHQGGDRGIEGGQSSSSSSSTLSLLRSLSPTTIFNNPHPFVVFDDLWTPIFFSSRESPYDSACILHAAKIRRQQQQQQQQQQQYDDENLAKDDGAHGEGHIQQRYPGELTMTKKGIDDQVASHTDCNETTDTVIIERTIVTDIDAVKKMVSDGELPLVPVRRLKYHQLLIQKSVNLFFHPETVRFFACQPYRLSPRTIYRFPAEACKGYVALTIDDCPCRVDASANSKLPEVLDLLQTYQSRATFMAIEQYISYPSHENDLVRLLKEGHELANHGIRDEAMDILASVPRANDRTNSTRGLDFHRSLGSSTHGHDDTVLNDLTKFDNDSGISPFVEAIDKCNRRIEDLKEMALGERTGVKWFRAPHGRYTKEMEHGLEMRGMYNVMCDSYAVDPIVEQSTWIGQSLLRQSRDGSILLLHMPESGFREYCLDALAILLDGLSKRGMKVVTVTELESIATRRKGDRTEKK